jgi:hypothetical protein
MPKREALAVIFGMSNGAFLTGVAVSASPWFIVVCASVAFIVAIPLATGADPKETPNE